MGRGGDTLIFHKTMVGHLGKCCFCMVIEKDARCRDKSPQLDASECLFGEIRWPSQKTNEITISPWNVMSMQGQIESLAECEKKVLVARWARCVFQIWPGYVVARAISAETGLPCGKTQSQQAQVLLKSVY